MFIVIEAMHLLPHPFELQTSYSSSQGRLQEQQHSSSQLLFGFSGKACRTSSRGRLFRFCSALRATRRQNEARDEQVFNSVDAFLSQGWNKGTRLKP
jgi:hypothetical protein